MFSQSLRSSALLAALFVGATVLTSTLRAQQSVAADRDQSAAQASTVATPAPIAAAEAAPLAGPRVAPAGITRPVQANPLGLAQPQGQQGAHVGAGSNIALMVVGAAAVVVGVALGNTGGYLIAVGGAVVGLLGLYRYIK